MSSRIPRLPQRKYSTLPFAPVMGEAHTPQGASPEAAKKRTISASTRRRTAGSRTTPPSPTSEAGASNCGLTRVRKVPVGVRASSTAGVTVRTLVKETSQTARSQAPR